MLRDPHRSNVATLAPRRTADATLHARGQTSADYGLCSCGGFDVRSNDGRKVGVVAYVRFAGSVDRPGSLVVRRGVVRRREGIISVDLVDEVDLEHRDVFLRAGAGDRLASRGLPRPT